jgi:hypothetical protein
VYTPRSMSHGPTVSAVATSASQCSALFYDSSTSNDLILWDGTPRECALDCGWLHSIKQMVYRMILRQTPALLRRAVSAALLHRWLALLCHAAFGLRSIPARLGFHIIHQHWQQFPIHQQPAWPRPFGLRRAQPLFPQSPIIGLSISGHWPV